MPQSPDKSARNTRFLIGFGVLAIAMVGAAYASVPLYNIFCKVTGYGGTTQTATKGADTVLDRMVTVRFDASTARGLDWEFRPLQLQQKIHIGENSLARFRAVNNSDHAITGQASYNITPQKAGAYFVKLQCFCFTEQTLQPGESADMPVIFFVSPDITDEPNLDDIKTITLSYTFFEKDKPKSQNTAALVDKKASGLH